MSQQQGLRFSFAQDRYTRRYILNKLLAHIEDGRYEDAIAIEGEFEDLEDYFPDPKPERFGKDSL
jgi:hypothetical protein